VTCAFVLEKQVCVSGKGVGLGGQSVGKHVRVAQVYLHTLILINCILVGGEWKKVISVLPKLVYCTKLNRVEWSHTSLISI
jgi:hypothetical protein